MTSASVLSRIKQELDDQGVFYTDADLYDSLQDGYSEVVLRANVIEKIVSVAFPTTVYWKVTDYVPDFYRLFAIFDPNQKLFLTPISIKSIDSVDDEWETSTGTPQWVIPIDFNYLAFYPTYAAVPTYNMYLFYFAQAPEFTSSTTLSIPSNCQSVLEDYVVNDLLDQSLEFGKSKIFYNNYLDGLNRTKKQLDGRNVRDRLKHFLVNNNVSLGR